MKTHHPFPRFSRAPGLFALASACLVTVASLDAAPVLPEFSAGNFTRGAPIDNPYFPLTPGTLFRTSATLTDPDTGETSVEVGEDFVTFDTEEIAGVTTRIVRARSFLDDLLIEDTIDRYAQDKSGNVWYFGEKTTAFEYDDDGNLVSSDTSGSWTAGVNDAKPGFVMPVDRPIGLNYFQEFAPNDDAVDQAIVLAVDEAITTPAGSFTNVLKTSDFTEIEPGVFENKYYAPGVGLILTEDLGEDGSVENSFPLVSVSTQAIPLPAPLWTGMIGLVVAAAVASRYRRRGGTSISSTSSSL